jgi:hypothetical protein
MKQKENLKQQRLAYIKRHPYVHMFREHSCTMIGIMFVVLFISLMLLRIIK